MKRAESNPSLLALIGERINRRMIQRRLALRRVEIGMTQKDVASAMKISRSAVSRLESGEHDVHPASLERFSDVLSVRGARA
jgi:transcriptional regulator with XRE-family HTH domain